MFLIGVSCLVSISGCGEQEKTQNEFAVGNWMQFRNRAYILLVTNPKGEWNSSVRIADATSKIVKSKGNAKGTWHIEKGQMIFTVTESDIEEIWEKNSTSFFDIVELTETIMQLKNESGRIIVWKQTKTKKAAESEVDLSPIVPMGPIAVNLNKNRSNDKDRYLCLNMNLVLKELMPDQQIPPLHPKAREAAIIFLSSLVFNDVKDFNKIKKQSAKLVDVLNPYMEGFIKEVAIEHVIVAAEIDKVEEFIIEHTMIEEPAPGEGEEGEEKSK
ncbi:MAG: flagellar basal body-associated FliL family protein [Desulfobacula sp.]|nr:flagellar basal body-associated FliL family protein [Desulfobacula sp.]